MVSEPVAVSQISRKGKRLRPLAFTCKQCGREYSSRKWLNTHSKKHVMFECATCARRFMHKDEVFAHIEREHERAMPWQCPKCNGSFVFFVTSVVNPPRSHDCAPVIAALGGFGPGPGPGANDRRASDALRDPTR